MKKSKFTDSHGHGCPANEPDAPVLWMVIPDELESGKLPFAEVARMGVVTT